VSDTDLAWDCVPGWGKVEGAVGLREQIRLELLAEANLETSELDKGRTTVRARLGAWPRSGVCIYLQLSYSRFAGIVGQTLDQVCIMT
jgi:hypothetical protein